MSDIKERYGAFGPAVVEQIRLELNRVGTLRELLKRLDCPAPDELEQQHLALYNLISRYGPLFFMTVAKSDWSVDQVQKMKKNLKAGVDTPLPGSRKRLTSGSISPSRGERLTNTPLPGNRKAASSVPAQVKRMLPPERNVVEMRSPYTAPAKGSHSTDPSPADTAATAKRLHPSSSGRYIDVPTYQGPDRRMTKERRVGPPDRRASLDTVYKNKRYGGKDRRKTVRRADDREKLSGSGRE